MAKLVVFAALLAALLAAASATTYRTVVTTTMVDEENPRGREESCMQEYQQQQKLNHCKSWMRSMRGRYFDASFLRSAVSNPMRGQGEHLQECCQQLEQISSPCMCEAMKMMWSEQKGSMREEMQEMREMVEKLPQMCGMETRERCRMNAA
ncbi:seed storage albumin 4 [Dorcoceras hygrometricum]|uniref:Seed storage albumin 4 n=1 Tax=Dorcoceras hygrometricum TaxID=472368 RepID=A0A2Z7C2V2_9LAMI|nr:seed storage albumin 4 [Dorcoceras hygrometricum]